MSLSSCYDTKQASPLLEALSRERANDRLAGLQLSNIEGVCLHSFPLLTGADSGHAGNDIKIRKSCRRGQRETTREIVWHIQGVITNLDLPPFYPRERSKYKARFLRQGLRLSGLGTSTFDAAMNGLTEVATAFSRTVTSMQPVSFVDADENGLFLDAANRYFSTRQDSRGGKEMHMDDSIDPTGALTKMVNDTHYYGEENVVEYLDQTHLTQSGRKSAVAIQPVTFKKGDVVEVQITLSAVTMHKNEWKLVATLRCVTLLDSRFGQVSFSRHSMNAPAKVLKRRCGADPEDDNELMELTTNKIRKMEIVKAGE
ncbi:hypothetical protein DFP72DRAFT_829985 [Ephemerocybe angulata]|uniref:Uncharacterized protein n=1 Tax=Ephemerocybe angulata TaxID=980116 RepID=A0A8H6HBH1_9AGAR|nr:hypothetical protein DFP72DRAFT_829985 [Tulosesus angulatus]